MVAGALVRYLLDQPDFHVTVASRTVSKAEALVAGPPNGRALAVDSDDPAALEADLARIRALQRELYRSVRSIVAASPSTEAVALLKKRGFRAAKLADGVAEWRAQGLPIET